VKPSDHPIFAGNVQYLEMLDVTCNNFGLVLIGLRSDQNIPIDFITSWPGPSAGGLDGGKEHRDQDGDDGDDDKKLDQRETCQTRTLLFVFHQTPYYLFNNQKSTKNNINYVLFWYIPIYFFVL